VTSTFKLNFTNAIPVVVQPMPDLTANTQENFEYKIPFTNYRDPANQNISISTNINTLAANAPLRPWLRFNPVTWSLYGVPSADSSGDYTITLTISDPFGGKTTNSFKLSVNARPTYHPVNLRIPSQIKTSQGRYVIDCSQYFKDEVGDVLRYSIRQANGLTVSSWVQLDQ